MFWYVPKNVAQAGFPLAPGLSGKAPARLKESLRKKPKWLRKTGKDPPESTPERLPKFSADAGTAAGHAAKERTHNV